MSTVDDLVKQVQELENATTDLLDATNLSKQTLDEAVDSATGSAQSAGTDAGTATEKRNEAVIARNEAVAARDDAEAIVHEGEGSTTPGGGKYPVAYADGQIDSGWLPLLQAMYPYSGVIGSVDKGSIFKFGQAAPYWVNSFEIELGGISFNINGRFVKFSENTRTKITLPEAEDTAARAVAFDDIFLDWNGNTVQHRSITPHRTSTGYDSDAIATEHGYTKVQNGLYRTSDSATYLLLLGRVARRNKGGYHPLWNPEGCGQGRQLTETGPAKWFASNVIPLVNAEMCFNLGIGVGYTADPRSSLTDTPAYLGRPNSEFYDAIYAEDFTPLYYSAQNITDRQALLFDSFNRAVAGETFMGAEGTAVSSRFNARADNSASAMYCGFGSRLAPQGIFAGQKAIITIQDDGGATLNSHVTIGEPLECVSQAHSGPGHQANLLAAIGFENQPWITAGNISHLVIDIISTGTPFAGESARPQFLAVDIIGSLAAMPQEWLDNGLPGNWLAVGEEGEDLIPDGTEKNYKLSRKALEAYLVLSTDDNGATWSDVTSTYQPAIETAGNTLGDQSFVAADCLMVFYRTAANPFELTSTVDFLAISRNPLAINGASLAESYIGKLTENMIGKVPVASTSSYVSDTEAGGFIHWGRSASSSPRHIQRNRLFDNRNTHGAFPYTSFGPVNPCAKHLSMLVSDSGGIGLQIVYKEMWYSSDSWGDDSRFDIVTNQSTTTNLNGETVIVGQKRCALPYQFDGVTF